MRKLSEKSLTHFVKRFLPEGPLVQDNKTELRSIMRLLERLFFPIEKRIFIDDVFTIFSNMKYHISVIEPIDNGELPNPYVITNSQNIFIAIDYDKLLDLVEISRAFTITDYKIPNDLITDFNNIQQFIFMLNED